MLFTSVKWPRPKVMAAAHALIGGFQGHVQHKIKSHTTIDS